jgi:hypothetical protein
VVTIVEQRSAAVRILLWAPVTLAILCLLLWLLTGSVDSGQIGSVEQ